MFFFFLKGKRRFSDDGEGDGDADPGDGDRLGLGLGMVFGFACSLIRRLLLLRLGARFSSTVQLVRRVG